MSDIKTRDGFNKKKIKVLDKTIIVSEKTKESLVNIKNKYSSLENKEQSENEYASNRITKSSEYVSNKVIDHSRQILKNQKNKVIKIVNRKRLSKVKGKRKGKSIKQKGEIVKNTAKASKNIAKTSQNMIKTSQKTLQTTIKTTKIIIKGTINTVKGIIEGTKALISAIVAGGWLAIVVIVVICLVGLLCSSVFGIFLSGEKTSSNSVSVKDVVAECDLELTSKLQYIQDTNPHDDYILDGKQSEWKDVLIIYAIKVSNGKNEQEVITINPQKKQLLKNIFWDMNEITFDVREENIIEQGTNALEVPKEVKKRVLHININSKTADQMKMKYNFNQLQLQQYNELSKAEYSSLWSGIILRNNSGDVNWKQRDPKWANVKIGNTNSTIADIGCLVTSVAILIEKSGIDTGNVKPFNPGTFVEALNNNGGFDGNGNLQYGAINKVVPNFRFVNKINLKDKTKQEKIETMKKYFESGYYLTVEVKGATEGNQHWVAVSNINNDNIIMIDPGSNQTDLFNAYELNKISKFNYFRAN